MQLNPVYGRGISISILVTVGRDYVMSRPARTNINVSERARTSTLQSNVATIVRVPS